MRPSLVHKRAASRWPIAPDRLRATVHDMVALGTQVDGWSPGCEHVASTDDLLLSRTRTVTPNVWQSSFVVSCTKGEEREPGPCWPGFRSYGRVYVDAGPGRSDGFVANSPL